MKRLLPFFFLAATAALPATSVTPAGQTGLALLSQVGTSLPATCAVGQLFFKSDATAGQNIYMCGSANTWTQGSGGSSGPCSAFGTSAGTCAQGNDSRITGAWQTASFGTGVATAAGIALGAAGGLLTNGGTVTPVGDFFVSGGSDAFKIVQDSTARTITWPAGNGTTTLKVKWPSGVPPTLTVTSGHIDDVTCNVWTAYLWDCVWAGDFQ